MANPIINIGTVSDDEKNLVKMKSAHALPNTPADHGMRAEDVKGYLWKPLVQGDASLAGILDRVIKDVNAAFGKVATSVIYDPAKAQTTVTFGDGKTAVLDGPRQGDPGAPGKDGKDGVSPTVQVVKVDGGHRVEITDASGVHPFLVPNGERGEGFSIAKTYGSVAEMKAAFGTETDDVPEGGLVLIATGSVEDADNAKLYVKDTTGYRYLTDLSGATGIQGPAGKDGVSPTIAVSEITGGYELYVQNANGDSRFFTVLHGKDGSDGDCRCDEETGPLANTLLLSATLGYHRAENYYHLLPSAQLADEILPDTDYKVNGTLYRSDSSGVLQVNDQYLMLNHEAMSFHLQASGNHLSMIATNGMELGYEWPAEIEADSMNEGEGIYTIEIVGPGAFTCVASVPLISGALATVQVASTPAPYGTLYVGTEAGQAVTLDEHGGCANTAVFGDAEYGYAYLRLYNGVVTLDAAELSVSDFDTMLMLCTEAEDTSSVPTDTGGRCAAVYRVPAGYNGEVCRLDPAKTYLIRGFEGSYYQTEIVVDRGECRLTVGSTDSGSLYFDDPTVLSAYTGTDLMVTVQELSEYRDVTCFIAGTKVLLRHPVTKALYEKKIEDVRPFEYAARWDAEKGRLTASRIIAPPIVGECTEYDRLTFSDGRTVDVYGVQFFWNVDTDRLQNWAEMPVGTRVCTENGDIVEYVGSEHIVSEVPVKHYTLLVYMGRYLAGGIQAGDKRELLLPRMLQPENRRWWRRLSEADRNGLRRAFESGMKRRNWLFGSDAVRVRQDFRTRRTALEREQSDAQGHLDGTDYQVIKLTEGVLSETEFAPVRQSRAAAREVVNRCRDGLAALEPLEAAELEAVRVAVAATYQPRLAGRFVGKNRAVLEEDV